MNPCANTMEPLCECVCVCFVENCAALRCLLCLSLKKHLVLASAGIVNFYRQSQAKQSRLFSSSFLKLETQNLARNKLQVRIRH